MFVMLSHLIAAQLNSAVFINEILRNIHVLKFIYRSSDNTCEECVGGYMVLIWANHPYY